MTPEEQALQEQQNQQQNQQPDPNQQQSAPANLLSDDPLADKALDKFRGQDGQIDAAKLAKSYRYLEQKMGSQDLPPASADEYGMPENLPEGLTPEALGLKEFLAEAHKAGMTKKQVDFVVGRYLDIVQRGTQAQQEQGQQRAQQAEATLQQEWGPEFEKMAKRAQKAFNAVADDNDRAAMADISANVPVMRLLAKLGANLEEDTSAASRSTALPAEDLQSLMKSEAYWDKKHPDHLKVKNAVTAAFQRK